MFFISFVFRKANNEKLFLCFYKTAINYKEQEGTDLVTLHN